MAARQDGPTADEPADPLLWGLATGREACGASVDVVALLCTEQTVVFVRLLVVAGCFLSVKSF